METSLKAIAQQQYSLLKEILLFVILIIIGVITAIVFGVLWYLENKKKGMNILKKDNENFKLDVKFINKEHKNKQLKNKSDSNNVIK